MNVVAIVCCDPNGVIGSEGKLPWDWPEQLRYFREATMHCPVIFGHRTMRSIDKPLPGRVPIVVSRYKHEVPEGWVLRSTPEAALEYAKDAAKPDGTVFVGGGGMIYRQMLPHCTHIDLTRISKTYEGDAYFPLGDVRTSDWATVSSIVIQVPPAIAKAGYNVVLRRRGAAAQ